jgi:diphosphomevalonate decarboxylase
MKENSYRPTVGIVEWSCPSNIAIVKYWGKKSVQIPMNPSLSLTLKNAITTTRIEFVYNPDQSDPTISFTFQGKDAPLFRERIVRFITGLHKDCAFLAHTSLIIDSANTFPHSSGIASSASAMGSLAMCLADIGEKIAGKDTVLVTDQDMLRKASNMARLGSGSASRSIFPGFAMWGHAESWPGSSDEYAIPVTGIHDTFAGIRDTILIVESGQKKVSSSAGHALMDTNPYATVRFQQARDNLARLRQVLKGGDWPEFITILEEEALSLHAMMMTGKPGTLLMQPGTLSILHKIQEFRKATDSRMGFTLDAGANVHLLYDAQQESIVREFISKFLVQYCEGEQVIHDQMGNGPVKKI